MPHLFTPGDFLIFQIEAGYGLLRVLDISSTAEGNTWHISAYSDLFLDIEYAEEAIKDPDQLSISISHTAMTERAFLSTQVSKLENRALTEAELQEYAKWQSDPERQISDRSIRLLLGLR